MTAGGKLVGEARYSYKKLDDRIGIVIYHPKELGANAVIGLRYDASEVVSSQSATEVLCYGTAVVAKQIR